MDQLEYGTLLWMRPSRRFGIKVPLDVLSDEQLENLKQYLDQEEKTLDDSNRSRLIWEYFYDVTFLVPVIELTKEQKKLLDPPKPKTPKSPYSYTNVDFTKLRQELVKRQKTWQDIVFILQNISGRPWSTKNWKQKRKDKIGNSCAVCGEQEGIMVLQHTRQPRKPETLIKEYEKTYREQIINWLNSEPIFIDTSAYSKDADACPKCNSQVVKYRAKKQAWVCLGVENKKQCGHVFSQPVKAVSKWIMRDLEKETIKKRKFEFLEASGLGEEIAKEALDEMIVYLSMENVTTLCKRCAFVADKTNLKLCKVCGKNYHKTYYLYCQECASK